MEYLKVYFVTYNVGTSTPDDSLLELLSLSSSKKKSLPDFYVLSFQEVSAQPHKLIVDAFYEDPWTRAAKEILSGYNYIKIKTIRLQGLVLSVFSLKHHLLNIVEIESNYTRTGLSGMWGNKGAVSVRLGIYGCSICFVNAHLSAHDEQLNDRIEDYNDIVRDQEFHIKGIDKIFYHDYVFWMGDLNFRLLEEIEKTPEEIDKLIQKGDLKNLFKYDQLKHVMSKKAAFSELVENDPTFPPTFKFEVGESKYDYKRRPAWTDRILYKVHENNHENVTLSAEQKSYISHPGYTLSDHKPVTAEFSIKMPSTKYLDGLGNQQVFSDYGEEIVKFDRICHWWDNDENTITFTFLKNHEINRDDWIGVYKADFSCLEEYDTYEYVSKKGNLTQDTSEEKHLQQGSKPPNLKYSITFSEPSSKPNGYYRLLYICETEFKVRSILGISEIFSLKSKDSN